MPTLFGRAYTKDELISRIGNISQLGGVRRVKLTDGPQEGVEAVEFRTATGLSFLAVPGRGLDITSAEHSGRSLAWMSAAGEMSPMYYEEPGGGWLRNFPGGLVTTCGLTYAGAACVDEGEALGLHGRYSNTSASNVWADGEWEGDEYRMWAVGKVRESRLFGDNLVLRRKISAVLGQNKIWIDDAVTNEGPRESPHMLLYHINAGFPVVDANTQFISTSKGITPAGEAAEKARERHAVVEPPTAGFEQEVYYHDMATDSDGCVYGGLVNKTLPQGPFGFYVKVRKSELPEFTQWKNNGTREYVMGLEPCNCHVDGRDVDRAEGRLKFLKPGETREYHLEITVLTTNDEVAQYEKMVQSIKG